MRKTIEVTVGKKPEEEVDLTKCASGCMSFPPSEEVEGHYSGGGVYECWNCSIIFRAMVDPYYYKYVRCPGCGALNRI